MGANRRRGARAAPCLLRINACRLRCPYDFYALEGGAMTLLKVGPSGTNDIADTHLHAYYDLPWRDTWHDEGGGPPEARNSPHRSCS